MDPGFRRGDSGGVRLMAGSRLALPAWATGLSARLLGLTFAFVMASEVLIFAPSAGRYRVAYLEDRLAAAHIAILALQATPDQAVSDSLEMELLDHARAYLIALRRPDGVKMVLGGENTPMADATFDLRDRSLLPLIGEAFMTLVQPRNRILRVIGSSPRRPAAIVEVVIDEAPMRAALIDYSERILALSLVISLITAGLLCAVDRLAALGLAVHRFAPGGPLGGGGSLVRLAPPVAGVGAFLPQPLHGGFAFVNPVDDAVELAADRAPLFRVLSNLARNAV